MFDMSKHYDKVYESTGEFIDLSSFSGWPRNRYEATVKFIGRGKRVLDIGCGNGLILYALRTRFDELHGIELSPVRASQAEAVLRKSGKSFSIKVLDITTERELPVDYYDAIISNDVIEHVVNIMDYMEHVARILRPGGRLILTTPNIGYLRYRLALLLGKFPSTGGGDEGFSNRPGELFDAGHLHYFTFHMLERLCRLYGITAIRRVGYGRLGSLHNLFPSLLSGAACVIGQKSSL